MARVEVNERVVRWAMERSGRPAEAILERFAVTDWLGGERQPTLRQLEEFASFTRTPMGYLFLDAPPIEKLPIPYFRTLGDKPAGEHSADLLETIHTLQRRQEWVRDYLVEQGRERLPFVGATPLDADPIDVANAIRKTLNLTADWAQESATWKDALQFLRHAMDDSGIYVVMNGVVGNNTHRKLNPDEFRGFVLIDEYAPFVFVNSADAKAAQMFTLAHELAHVFFGVSAAFDLRGLHPADDRTEKLCNLVAAEFLVPSDALRDVWVHVRGQMDPYAALARRFKVSEIVVARRLLDLGLMTRQDFFVFYEEYRQRIDDIKARRDESGGHFFNTQNVRVGQRFFGDVVQALQENAITYTEAYRLTGLHGKTFHRYAEAVAGGATG